MLAVFENPGLLGALALTAIPVLIHLAARKRHQHVSWAAMELIARARRRLRQRVEMRDWILLAIRVGIVAAIVLAAAGPVAPPAGLLAAIAPGDREVVIVLDTSASMDTRANGASRLRRAVLEAQKLLDSLGPTDRVTLVTYDRQLRFEAREHPSAGQVRDLLERIVPSARADVPFQAVSALIEDVTTRPGAKDVFLFSDFPVRGWAELTGTELPGTARSGDPIRWTLVPSTATDAGNLAVAAIEVEPTTPVRGEPACVRVRVLNPTDREVDHRELKIRIDGGEPVLRAVRAPARDSVEVVLAHRFTGVGPARVEASLDPDALPADDHRSAVVEVQARPRITLVASAGDRRDRDPGPLEFLAAALQACVEEGRWALDLDRITPETLVAEGAGSAAVLVVADLATVPPGLADRLKEAVTRGGSLVLAAGPKIVPARYNRQLDAASGVLPFRLEPESRPHDPPIRLRIPPGETHHRALRFLAGLRSDHLGRSAIRRTLAPIRVPPRARVLLQAGEPNGVPLLIETPVGRGRVFWFSTTLDTEWSDLPTPAGGNHLFVPMMIELMQYAVAPDRVEPRPTVVGDPLRFILPPGAAVSRPRVLGPDGLPAESVTVTPAVPGAGSEIRVRAPELPGVYRLRRADEVAGPGGLASGDRLAAVVVDPIESDPRTLDPPKLAGLFPDPVVSVSTGEHVVVPPPPRGGAIGRWLLLLTAALLLLESALAAYFGRGRS